MAVFPADTVYGLACEPDSKEAVQRLYLLKRRRPDKPAAVMFFDVEVIATRPPTPITMPITVRKERSLRRVRSRKALRTEMSMRGTLG